MGQPITVTVRAGAAPNMRFFECNRSLTGMAIEMYTADSETLAGATPARRARATAVRRRRDQGHDLLERRDRRGAGRGVGRARAQGRRSRSSTSSSSTATTRAGRSRPAASSPKSPKSSSALRLGDLWGSSMPSGGIGGPESSARSLSRRERTFHTSWRYGLSSRCSHCAGARGSCDSCPLRARIGVGPARSCGGEQMFAMVAGWSKGPFPEPSP